MNDESIGSHCFDRFTSWEYCPSKTIRDVEEIYQRLVPIKVYYGESADTKLRYLVDSTICQLCKEQPETVAHILAGCPALAQNHYTARHNSGLKCLYFTLLKHYGLVNRIPPWHSAIVSKPQVKNDQVRILRDVPTPTAECRVQTTSHQGNRADVTVFDKRAQEILVFEFSCPWVTNRVKKDKEKTTKYAQVCEELKARHPGYTIKQN